MADKKETKKRDPSSPTPTPNEPPPLLEIRPQTWADPGTWTGSMKFFPAYIAIAAVVIALLSFNFLGGAAAGLDSSSYESCVATFNYSFRINAALSQAQKYSQRSWEIGYAHEATMQVHNPERSVFAREPFPHPRGGGRARRIPGLGVRLDEASLFAQSRVRVLGQSLFDEEGGAVGDPASLGVAAVLFAQRWYDGGKYLKAAERQRRLLVEEAPRLKKNGAISHRWERREVWADGVGMFPPFLAYLGVAMEDVEVLREAVEQCGKYREILRIGDGEREGLWRHIVCEDGGDRDGDGDGDEGAWSTGNAWAAYGMARVRATVAGYSESNVTMREETEQLDQWIGEILDGAIRTDTDSSGLLRNYFGEESWFGETSGTSLLAATAYRMAVMRPEYFGTAKHLDWANAKRRAVFRTVDDDGFAKPAVNPLDHKSREPVDISPEGESFLLLLGTAWRDCVCAGLCMEDYLKVTQVVSESDVGRLSHANRGQDPQVSKPAVSLNSLFGFSLQELLNRWQRYLQAP